MPPITSISSVPPDLARPESRARDRRRLGSEVVDQVQRSLGSRASQAPLAAALQAQQQGGASAAQARATEQPRLRPPADMVQRFFSERQAVLREAALQRDEVLQQQASDQLRPIAQAQREADRLQVLRDAQLLETQRLVAQRIAPAADTEPLLAQQEMQRLSERQDAARLEEQRLQEEYEAERLEEEEEAQRLEQEREVARIEEQQEAARSQELEEAERAQAQRETERRAVEGENANVAAQQSESDRATSERAALAYRGESERAVASARVEAEQPLSEQLRLARERLDALEARRIDRVDVSDASLSRLVF